MPVTSRRFATLAHVAPFLAYVCLLQVERGLTVPLLVSYPLRFLAVALLLVFVSRPFVPLKPSFPVASAGIGIAVFLIWVGPDVLFHYRHHWLFENALTGVAASSIPPQQRPAWLAAIRVLSTVGLVPILEELFWRSWLMRWLIDADFQAVPLGQYSRAAFWLVALMFASEHGPFWEVGLAAGIIYNWWLVRTRNLADCILAHAVTNAVLAAYVLAADQWQYWL